MLFYFAINGKRNGLYVKSGRGDCFVIAFVGAMFQLALAVPLVFIALNHAAEHHLIAVLDSSADYYAPLVVYPISIFYFTLMTIVFLVYEDKQRHRVRGNQRAKQRGYDTIAKPSSVSKRSNTASRHPISSSSALVLARDDDRDQQQHSSSTIDVRSVAESRDESTRTLLRRQEEIAEAARRDDEEEEAVVIRELSESTVFNVTFIVPLGLIAGAVQTAILRVCRWNGSEPCTDNNTFSFGIALYRNDAYYRLATVFWFFQWSSLVISCLYAVCISYQELRQLEEFTYIDENKSRMLGKIVADLLRPRKLHAWVNIFHRVVEDQKLQALSQAVMGPTAFCVIFTAITAATYVVMDNVANDKDVAEFTSGCIFAAIFSFVCAVGFIVITVRMQKLVEYQALVVSKVQSDVQHQVDENDTLQGVTLSTGGSKATTAKIRALQALGLYIRLAESKPKIMGMSLETVRWSTIVLGMFFLNAGFFILYVKRCYE